MWEGHDPAPAADRPPRERAVNTDHSKAKVHTYSVYPIPPTIDIMRLRFTPVSL